jgi:hypothetical protein
VVLHFETRGTAKTLREPASPSNARSKNARRDTARYDEVFHCASGCKFLRPKLR